MEEMLLDVTEVLYVTFLDWRLPSTGQVLGTLQLHFRSGCLLLSYNIKYSNFTLTPYLLF